jgi:hypothetical protein
VDNTSGSLVSNPKLLIDAKAVNESNDAFSVFLEVRKQYEFRGRADGYDDLVQTVKFDPKTITLSISPLAGDVNTKFNITTDVPNSTLTVVGLAYNNNYYGTLSAGLNQIKVSKDGYDDAFLNITVEDSVRVLNNPLDFKRGKEFKLALNKNVSLLRVLYQKDTTKPSEEYFNGGAGITFTFTPKKTGLYYVEADGRDIASYQITGFSFYNKWWFMPAWGWILGFVVLFFIIVAFVRGGSEPTHTGAELTYPVGNGGG